MLRLPLLIIALATSVHAQPVTQPIEPAPATLEIPEGFVAEVVFRVPPDTMGSWVSLATDGRGRLIASDQADKGLYLITPGTDATPTEVEKLPVDFSGTQGMVVVGDTMYASRNGGSGMFRLTASAKDGKFDKVEKLFDINGEGEHGPHAVRLGPDGKSLYLLCGNYTALPKDIEKYNLPPVWGDDRLLPQMEDPNGHAVGLKAPAGFVLKMDLDGNHREVISTGFRNPYDMAFNADGELFVYDADMEWDLGLPWYLTTRLIHAVPGGEYGWRSGSIRWPQEYEDSLPPIATLGPGSPVGVTFGYGGKFPAKFQQGLFLLDWTYGTIYLATLEPDAYSYKAKLEQFAQGEGLPLTDCVIGDDGHLYFTVGGRGTQSLVYRVRYVGNESTASPPDAAKKPQAFPSLIQFGIEEIIPFESIGSADRLVRYFTRLACERRGVKYLRDKANSAIEPLAVTELCIALARHGDTSDRSLLLSRLGSLPLAELDETTQSAILRAIEVVAVRLGPLEQSEKDALRAKLEPLAEKFASAHSTVDRQWFELMVYLESPLVIERGIRVMNAATPAPTPDWLTLAARKKPFGGSVDELLAHPAPTDAIFAAFVLRSATAGWTPELRRQYFAFFPAATQKPGGYSYAKSLAAIRDDARNRLSIDEQTVLGELLSVPLLKPAIEVVPPQGPGHEWTKDEVLKVAAELKNCDFNNGRNLFHAVGCIKCHRFDGEGEAIGPDLSTVANKFTLPDLIDAIVDPSKAISDQYGSHQIITNRGKVLTGRVVKLENEIRVYTSDYKQPPVVLKPDEIDEMEPSKVSQMPTKQLDPLNESEVRDLIAYLLSRGDQNREFFNR